MTDAPVSPPWGGLSSELSWTRQPSCRVRRQGVPTAWFWWRPMQRTRFRRGSSWRKVTSSGKLPPRDWGTPHICLLKTLSDCRLWWTASSGCHGPSAQSVHLWSRCRRRQLKSWKDSVSTDRPTDWESTHQICQTEYSDDPWCRRQAWNRNRSERHHPRGVWANSGNEFDEIPFSTSFSTRFRSIWLEQKRCHPFSVGQVVQGLSTQLE